MEMKRFLVTYRTTHRKEFYVPSMSVVKQILSDRNEIEILDYEELPNEE
jgi:hypothetical protein